DIRVSFDWNSSDWGMQVGWIWVKQGLANAAPRRWARQAAVTLVAMAFVVRWKSLGYPPVASTTAWAAWLRISPVIRSRETMPSARPSLTTRSSISARLWSF